MGKNQGKKRVKTGLRTGLESLESRRLLTAVLIEDIVAGVAGSTPANFTQAGDLLYFTATTPVHGMELWKTDGTAEGTSLVKDIRPGAGSSVDTNTLGLSASRDGLIYFLANDGVSGSQLWRSDGTDVGTFALTSGAGPVRDLVAAEGKLFFNKGLSLGGAEHLWVTDGTVEGTRFVADPFPGTGRAQIRFGQAAGGNLYFSATNGVNGQEVWTSDGTPEGTYMVRDLIPGASSSDPSSFTAMGDRMYFTTGAGVWSTDGTSAGTTLVVTGIVPSQNRMVNMNGTLVFQATGPAGRELYRSDGTAAGTTLLKDINPGAGSITVTGYNVTGSHMFFPVTTGITTTMYVTDGTEAGTMPVRDLIPVTGNPLVGGFVDIDGTLYFAVTTSASGAELYKSDYTAAGTQLVQDLNPGPASSIWGYLREFRGDLYFSANNGTSGVEPFYLPINEAPIAQDGSFTTDEDQSVLIDLRGLVSDFETGVAGLSFDILTPPTGGVLEATADAGVYRFVPDADFSGNVSFTYQVTDNGDPAGSGQNPLSATATIGVEVAPVNDAPTAGDVVVVVTQDGSATVALAGTDVETAAANLRYRITTLPTLGTLYAGGIAVVAGQEFVGSPSDLSYVPDAAVEAGAEDSFQYVVTDTGDGDSSALTSDPARVSLLVGAAGAAGSVTIDAAGIVRVVGTGSGDVIELGTAGGFLAVNIGGTVFGGAIAMSSVTEVRVYAGAGNDIVDASGLSHDVYVNAGEGDDDVTGGSGDNLLLGGAGNDKLTGASGDDLLIGGAGADRIAGSSGNDILASGSLNGSIAALRAALASWASQGAAGSETSQGAGDIYDGVDVLTGASGADWFLIGDNERITGNVDATDGDLVTVLG